MLVRKAGFHMNKYMKLRLIEKCMRKIDKGFVVSKLKVIGVPFYIDFGEGSQAHVVARCQCGNVIVMSVYKLTSKRHINSCGCLRGIETGKKWTTHGMSKNRLYNVWKDMLYRCYTPSSFGYEYYGGRGIRVCRSWRESIHEFVQWAETNGYKEGLELDRKDPNGNYQPSNCRWATRRQQMYNVRKRNSSNNTSEYKGVIQHRPEKWRAIITLKGKPKHLGVFDSEIAAAKAYDKAARKHFGEFAFLNFPRKECALS